MPVDFREAIFRQPENLRAGAEAFREAIAGADLAALRGGTVVLSGIGASAHALTPALLTLRAGGVRAFSVTTTQLRDEGAARLGDAYVLVSQSGASAETVEAVQRVSGSPVIAISANGDSPLARAADVWLPLGPMQDTQVATLSYTATLQALGMLCDALLANRASGWETLPEIAGDLLARTDPIIERIAPGFAEMHALDAVGGGHSQASAEETSLLVREGLRVAATGMETRSYLHGPMEPVGPGFGCIVFGRGRERLLASELASFGATVAFLTDDPVGVEGVDVISLPEVDPLAAPVLEILPVQLLAEHISRLRGLPIGELRRHQDDTKVV